MASVAIATSEKEIIKELGSVANEITDHIYAMLETREVYELRAEVSGVLICSKCPKVNMTKSKWKALKWLK